MNTLQTSCPWRKTTTGALVGMASTLLIQRGARHVATAETYLQRAKQLADKKSEQMGAGTRVRYLEGIIEEKKGNRDKAKALFVKSIEADRSPGQLVAQSTSTADAARTKSPDRPGPARVRTTKFGHKPLTASHKSRAGRNLDDGHKG